jgi:hypothetical protein
VEGQISSIDWVGSKMVVRWLADSGKYDEIMLFVPDNTPITRGTETADFTDLEEGDKVLVAYYDASPGPLTVTSVMVYISN